MLWSRYREAVGARLQPLASALLRAGVSPNAVTLATLGLGALVCLWFVRSQAVLPFCLAITAVGCLDVLDGLLARAGGRVTPWGGYLDAMCDRYFEAMVVLAAAAVTGYWGLSLLALSGSLLVSYAKARAALEVPVSNQEWPDLMERGERHLLFIAGLAASRLVPWRPLGRDLFWWTLLLGAGLTHLTVLQRVARARRLIQARSRSSRPV